MILTSDGKQQVKRSVGEPTGFADNNLVPIRVGDRMRVGHFCNCEYCRHCDDVEVLWNEEWKAYGMRTADGRWVSGMGVAGAYSVQIGG
jgi:hypothetical protein